MSKKCNISSKLYISGMDADAYNKAKNNNLGYEISAFSWAPQLTNQEVISKELAYSKDVNSCIFHAPFAELSPCAIDPLVRDITKKRYLESIELAAKLGTKRIVVHSGFIPLVYYDSWFIEQSIIFWKDFFKNIDFDGEILLENGLDEDPKPLLEIVEGVNNKALRICLDIGHANSKVSNIPVMTWIDTLLPYIRHTHIHNNYGEMDLHNPLPEGNIDVESVLDILLEKDVTFTIENMNCDSSIQWLKNKGYLPFH